MAKLPEIKGRDTLADLVDEGVLKTRNELFSQRIGASKIGHECCRHVWYSFRWCEKPSFTAQGVRILQNGIRKEAELLSLLELAGLSVRSLDDRGRQMFFSDESFGGHIGGMVDGIATGLPESTQPHVIEAKSHNDKTFKALTKDGVLKSNPRYFAQVQLYMHWSGLKRALYMAVNKNDESLYFERLAYDKGYCEALIEKTKTIVNADEPPVRISDNDTWHTCKTCEFNQICHTQALPEVNCRTCLHSTPLKVPSQAPQWKCEKWNSVIPHSEMLKPQPCHRYIPALIPFAAPMDVDENDNVVYEMRDGSHRTFKNGDAPQGLPSLELKAIAPEHIGDSFVQEIRERFDAVVVPNNEAIDEYDDDVPF